MKDYFVQAFFCVLPLAVFAALYAHPKFFAEDASTPVANVKFDAKGSKGFILLILACAPLSLVAFSGRFPLWLAVAFVLTALGAGYGAYRTVGAAGAASAAVLVVISLVGHGSAQAVSISLLSFAVALGCAHAVAAVLPRKQITFLLGAFLLLDFWIVYISLSANAVDTLMFLPAGFGQWANSLPIFNRITIADQVLGSIDVAYVALAAAVMLRYHATVREMIAPGLVLLVSQSLIVIWVFNYGQAFPATIPAALALMTFGLTRFAQGLATKRHERSTEEANMRSQCAI